MPNEQRKPHTNTLTPGPPPPPLGARLLFRRSRCSPSPRKADASGSWDARLPGNQTRQTRGNQRTGPRSCQVHGVSRVTHQRWAASGPPDTFLQGEVSELLRAFWTTSLWSISQFFWFHRLLSYRKLVMGRRFRE